MVFMIKTEMLLYHLNPYNSWLLNEETCCWEAPVPYPQDGNLYIWNEETLSWNLA
jgi:hypothetical protein